MLLGSPKAHLMSSIVRSAMARDGLVRPRLLEFTAAAALITIGVLGQIWLANASDLLSRHLWHDEILSETLATDPDLGRSMQALAAGVETHPPTYYLLLRAWTLVMGRTDEWSMRSLSLLATIAALTGLYVYMRRAFSIPACIPALIVVWSGSLIMGQAFEARMYAVWLAAIVWFAVFLSWCDRDATFLTRLLVAVCAIVVCTVHYFGIVPLVLVASFEFWRRSPGPGRWTGFTAASSGLLALAACLPFLIGQRRGISESTWVPVASLESTGTFLTDVLLPRELVIVMVVGGWLAYLLRRDGLSSLTHDRVITQAGLSSLLLMPVALVLFSYAIMSVQIPRYAIPAILALGPLAAYQTARMPSWCTVLLSALLFGLSCAHLHNLANEARHNDERSDRLIARIRRLPVDRPVLFRRAVQLYPILRYAPDLADRCLYADFESAHHIANVTGKEKFCRQLAHRRADYYGTPSFISRDGLPKRFYFVPHTHSKKKTDLQPMVAKFFPDSDIRQISPLLFKITCGVKQEDRSGDSTAKPISLK
jgi:hypothetical protein